MLFSNENAISFVAIDFGPDELSARNTLPIQYWRYCASVISRTFLRITSRSRAAGALIRSVTLRLDDQYWRPPRRIFRGSPELRSSIGTSPLTTTTDTE